MRRGQQPVLLKWTVSLVLPAHFNVSDQGCLGTTKCATRGIGLWYRQFVILFYACQTRAAATCINAANGLVLRAFPLVRSLANCDHPKGVREAPKRLGPPLGYASTKEFEGVFAAISRARVELSSLRNRPTPRVRAQSRFDGSLSLVFLRSCGRC
jgi:hypothetical protein